MEALSNGALVKNHAKLDFNSNDIKSDDEYKIWVFIIVMIIIIVIIVNLDEDYEGGHHRWYHSNPYDDFLPTTRLLTKRKDFFLIGLIILAAKPKQTKLGSILIITTKAIKHQNLH